MAKAKPITVGDLRKFLKKYPRDTDVTFGASKHVSAQFVFYRFKRRGDTLLQLECNELYESDIGDERDYRRTAGELLRSASFGRV